jgi:hypothetical protein
MTEIKDTLCYGYTIIQSRRYCPTQVRRPGNDSHWNLGSWAAHLLHLMVRWQKAGAWTVPARIASSPQGRQQKRRRQGMTDASTVAKWMLSELRREGALYQESAVSDIEDRFGERFVYDNENGNRAISREVLSAFRKLTGATVVWDRTERYWRLRESGDDPSRSQA